MTSSAVVGEDDLVARGGSASHGKKRGRSRMERRKEKDRFIFIPVGLAAQLPRFNCPSIEDDEDDEYRGRWSPEGARFILEKSRKHSYA